MERAVYDGHHRVHGLSWLAGVSYNGLCLSLVGPKPGSCNDKAMIAGSNVFKVIDEHCLVEGSNPPTFYRAYGAHQRGGRLAR